MSSFETFTFNTNGERFYSVTSLVQERLEEKLTQLKSEKSSQSGVMTLFTPHTSCALTINESYDPLACQDMENFLKHLAPRNLGFIQHKDEGEDDSPSHMKSILLQPSLSLIIDQGKLVLGTWQGIYLCEFRDDPKTRKLYLKIQLD